MEYDEFLKNKMKIHNESGFHVDFKDMNLKLFDFQKFCVQRALKHGRYALFEDTGLGKTIQQIEWAAQVHKHTGKKVLILCPLAVKGQTLEEARKFGYIPENFMEIWNYEQLDNLNPDNYSGVVLDESSILKNFDGAYKKKIIDVFSNYQYKLACTATPSPNDPEELGNHSEFLNVMSRTEMLAMYFVHAGDTGDWRIKGHAVRHFWEFVSSWSIMVTNPADIGFPMAGYELPPLNIVDHKIETENKNEGNLFNDSAVSATDFNGELRRTMNERMKIAAEIANQSTDQVIVWIKQNEEGKLLKSLIPGSVEVKGDDSPEFKQEKLLGFAKNQFRILITKSKIAQFGLNYQNCNLQVFASLDFSFESLYQSIRRSYRFGQKKEVSVHIITTDTMANVKESISEKELKFKEMQKQMSISVNANLNKSMMTEKDYNTDDVSNEFYTIKRGDCVRLIKDIPDDSIGFSVFSPPFADLFTYSSHVEDMGNNKDFGDFKIQFDFLVKELYRVIKPGRNVAVHCMDLPTQKGRHGHIGIRDFSGDILRSFEDAGFIYHSKITIWKDPVVAMQRTKALGLLHKQIKKDSTMSRVGIPDNVLVFRKDGERIDPVTHYGSIQEAVSNGVDIEKYPDNVLDVGLWQKYASPIWMDIDQGDTLNFRLAREEEDEKHLCPLQLGVIKRLLHLYTNYGDSVLTPFMGIGSEVYQSVFYGRKGVGFELKESYFNQAKNNLATLEKELTQMDLF